METFLFVLKLAVLASLYLFLFALFRAIWQEWSLASIAGKSVETLAAIDSRLVVLNAGDTDMKPGDILYLTPRTLIGRSLSSTIVLLNNSISSIHAVLTFRDERWWIEDMGSTNGTILNGILIEGRSPVCQHDILELGKVALQLDTP